MIRPCLRNADDRLARAQLAGRQTEIEVALDIEGRHSRIVGIVEPLPGSQRPFAAAVHAAIRFRLGFVSHRSRLPPWRCSVCRAGAVTPV